MKEGEERTIKQVCKRRKCEYCDKLATVQLTFLLPNCRSNPASSAYGKDDCSWCSDAEVFVCDKHEKDKYGIAEDNGKEWCAEYPYGERFKHLFLYWETVKED